MDLRQYRSLDTLANIEALKAKGYRWVVTEASMRADIANDEMATEGDYDEIHFVVATPVKSKPGPGTSCLEIDAAGNVPGKSFQVLNSYFQ